MEMTSEEVTQKKTEEEVYKIVIDGSSGVGKSNIFSRFLTNTFNPESEATVGVEFDKKVTEVDKKKIKRKPK
jgi:Ras-related protein Rab-11B